MEIINLLLPLVIALVALMIPVGLICSVVLGVKASHQQDKSKKKKAIIMAVLSGALPIVLTFALISFWGLSKISSGSLGN